MIDADNVIPYCCQYYKMCEKHCDECGFLIKVRNIPTAYDVDRVVEQLKDMSGVQYDCDKCGAGWEVHDCIYTKNAIDIVKKGGK